jgi:hypothetical protein
MLFTQTERLEVNLGSSQLIEILDSFIYKAIDPIFTQAPNFSLQWVCDMLCMINTTPNKRKFSVNMENALLSKALGKILTCKAKDRLEMLKTAALERIYLITFVNTFLIAARKALPENAPELLSDARNLDRLQVSTLLGIQIWAIEPVVNKVVVYHRLTHTFVSYIAEKYEKLAMLRTRAMMKGNGLHISEKDLYMNNSMMVVRAIYKYSAAKGTLTDFILLWMRSNNSPRFAHEYDLSYTLPQGKRNALTGQGWEERGVAVMNFAVTLDDAEEVASDISGSMLSASEDKSCLQLLYRSATMLKDEADVRFYMKASGFPDLSDQLVCYKTLIEEELESRVNYLCDLKQLDGPVKKIYNNCINVW